MRKLFYSFLLSFLYSVATPAQTPTLRYTGPDRIDYCLGTELALDILIIGEFPKNSTFQVIARQYENSQVCDAFFKDGQLITRVTSPVFGDFERVSLSLKSSHSSEEIRLHSIYVHAPSTVSITSKDGKNADTLNLADALHLKVHTSKPLQAKIILDSGDSVMVGHTWYNPNVYHKVDIKRPYQKSYAIKEVQGLCNSAIIEKQKVSIHLNEIEFKVVNAFPTQLCEGNDLMVYFHSSQATIPANNQFKVRFSNNNYWIDSYKHVDVPAELIDENTLKVKVPTFSESFYNGEVFIGIVTTNPVTVSNSSQVKLFIYPTPSFKLTATSTRLGEQVELASNPKGMPPFNLIFESGETMQYFTKTTLDTPTKVYKVKRFETGCGTFENPTHTPLTVTAEPSIYIEPMDSTLLCAGGTYRIPIKTTGGITSSTDFRAMVGVGYNTYTYFSGEVKGDYFEFTVPVGLNNFDNFKQGYNQIQVISQNPELTSNIVSVHFPDMPKIRLNQAASIISLPSPGTAELHYELSGGLNYTINFANGTTVHTSQQSILYHKPVISQSTDYTVTSISNQCFVNSNPVSTPITVANPNSSEPFIHLEVLNQKRYCTTDSIELYVHVLGKFAADNRFELEFRGNVNQPLPNMPIQPGYNKIKLQIDQLGEFIINIDLIATNPSLSTMFTTLLFQSTPTSYIPHVYPEDRPNVIYEQGNNKLHIVKSNADEVRYTLNDKPATYRFPANDPYLFSGTLDIPFQPNQLTKYTLLSASNTCGSTYFNPPVSTYYKSLQYEIQLIISQNTYCVNQPSSFSFQIQNSTIPQGRQYTLQMQSAIGSEKYEDIQTLNAVQTFHFKMPRKPLGRYYFRVMSSDGIVSQRVMINLNTTPSVTINHSPNQANYASIPYGTTLPIFIYKNGIETSGVQFSDSTITNEASYTPTIFKDQRFTITSVWNECGFGSAREFVEVKVAPVLDFRSTDPQYDQLICPDKEIEVSYDLKAGKLGPNDRIIFKLSSAAMQTVRLDSTSQQKGTIKLKIPKTIYGSEFQVTAEIASLKLISKLIYYKYEQASLTLYGDQYIAQGDYVSLMVKVNKPFLLNRPLMLSDSSVHHLEYNQENRIEHLHIKNFPRQTTTYTINPIQDFCGYVDLNGKATVVVTPRKAQQIIAPSISLNRPCNGDKLTIWFEELGLRNANNEYEVLLKESLQGTEYILPARGTRSPIEIQIPDDIPDSDYYKIYVRSKNPDISSGLWASTSIYRYASATIETPYVQRSANNTAEVKLKLEGSKPISYTFLSAGRRYEYSTTETNTKNEIFLEPNQTSFELIGIRNQCGDGTILSSPTIEVALITGIEKEGQETIVSFGPNPTTDQIHFTFTTAHERNLELVSSQDGTILQHIKSASLEVNFHMATYPSGVYLVRVKEGKETKVYKISKH